MSATNKFKVYGQEPAESNVFPTSDSSSSDYIKLFSKGIKPDTVAKAQDVLTPLRELTIFSVSFFNWLVEQGLTGDLANVVFEDAEVDSTEDPDNPGHTMTEKYLTEKLLQVKTALTQAITNKIGAKEPIITRDNSTNKGILTYNGSAWEWKAMSYYQLASAILTQIDTFLGTSANKGLLYKSTGNNNLKSSNKQFVYYDSESTDSSGNKILNLKIFDPDSNS